MDTPGLALCVRVSGERHGQKQPDLACFHWAPAELAAKPCCWGCVGHWCLRSRQRQSLAGQAPHLTQTRNSSLPCTRDTAPVLAVCKPPVGRVFQGRLRQYLACQGNGVALSIRVCWAWELGMILSIPSLTRRGALG